MHLTAFEQELVVSATVAAAAVGAASASWAAARLGRRGTVVETCVVFIAGAAVMAAAPSLWELVLGRAIVGFAIGQASMVAPLYLSEVAPPALRGRLVSLNILFLTGGQCIAGLVDGALARHPDGWRWMLGASALPAAAQLAGCLLLPESPRWLAAAGRREEARAVLQRIHYSAAAGGGGYAALPKAEHGTGGAGLGMGEAGELLRPSVGDSGRERGIEGELDAMSGRQADVPPEYTLPVLCGCAGVQRGRGGSDLAGPDSDEEEEAEAASAGRLAVGRWSLTVATGVQALQQLAGINIAMYYSGRVLQQAGFGTETAIWLSAALAGVNCVATLVAMRFVDSAGRRPLLLASSAGVIVALGALGGLFAWQTALSPAVTPTLAVTPTAWQGAAPPAWEAGNASVTLAGTGACAASGISSCAACVLRPQCGFFGSTATGVCLGVEGEGRLPRALTGAHVMAGEVHGHAVAWHDAACPGEHAVAVGWAIFAGIVLHLLAYAPGLGSVAWVVSAEATPAPLRSVGLSAAATTNWSVNLAVSLTFLTLLQAASPAGTFWGYAGIMTLGLAWIAWTVPETRGVALEDTEAELLKAVAAARRRRWWCGF